MACTKFNHKDTLDWKARLEAPDGSVFVQIKLSMFSKALKQEPRDKAVCANPGLDLPISFQCSLIGEHKVIDAAAI